MTRKRMIQYYDIYSKGSGKTSLSDCYGKCSKSKQKAFEYCLQKAFDFKSEFGRCILTYNRMMFTYGFKFTINGIKYFAVITKTGTHIEEISKLNAYRNYLISRERKNSEQI